MCFSAFKSLFNYLDIRRVAYQKILKSGYIWCISQSKLPFNLFFQVFLAVELPLGIIVTFHTVASSLSLTFLNYEVMAIMIMFLNMIIALSYPLNFGIYCGMSQQFRETFMKLFGPWIPNMPKCCCQCKRENDSHTSLDAVSTGTPPLTLFFETLKNRVSGKPCC